MKDYMKPVVLMNEELSEGVYAASGDGDCWSVTAYIHQTPETGRDDYRIQTDGYHDNTDNHFSNIHITYHFNQTVTFSFCNGGSLVGSATGTSITIERNIGTKNAHESLGLGDVVVTSGPGLVLSGVSWVCTGK